MGPDQLRPLYAVILAGTVLGAALSAALFSPRRLVPLILTSIVLVIVGSSMDLDASNLTRPHDLFVSQFLVSTAAGMFLGPLLVLGMTPVLARGTDYVITLIVVFSLTQSIGGLAGPAAFATFQQYREHEYSALLVADVDPTDAAVARRIQQQAQPYAALITDPVRLRAQGVAQLSQAVTREANVRAYNDVVWLNLFIALVFLVWSLTQTPPARRLAKSILAATFTAKGVS